MQDMTQGGNSLITDLKTDLLEYVWVVFFFIVGFLFNTNNA